MKELIIDNFAGGGGASTGIEMAVGRSVDIAINHDPAAIAMHKANHPNTKHYCEDVWNVSPAEACKGQPVALAWFSPDCTHFSRAKGGKPVDKNIRGLAWVTLRWALQVRPRVIMLENVPEIQTWGPLNEHNQPDKAHSGETFNGFISALSTGIPRDHPAFGEMVSTLEIDPFSEDAERLIKGLGYKIEYRELMSCDYGAPTTRKRLYLIARSDGKPIRWAEPTYGERHSADVKSGKKKPWRSAAECIDWTLPAQSIFERKKPLAKNTLKRIARGIKKFVIENPEPFIINYKFENEPEDINKPLSTITAVNSHYVVTPTVMCNNTGNKGSDVQDPLHTVTTGNRNFLVAPTLIQYHGETADGEVRGQAVDEPIMTVDTANRYALSVAHIMKNYAGGYKGPGSDVKDPLGTVTAQDHNSLVTAHILTFRNNQFGQSLNDPLSTVETSGTHHAEVQAFLIKYFSNGTAKSIHDPLDTVTTKDRFALVTINGEEYIITDIKMRMLMPHELFKAQGKPLPKYEQTRKCGNAVTPQVPCALVRCNLPELCGA